MIRYEALVDRVRDDAGLAHGAEAGLSTAVVLNGLAQLLPPPERQRLAGQLPGSLDQVVDVETPIQDISAGAFMTAIADRLAMPAERARLIAQSVLRGIGEQDQQLLASVCALLPSDVLAALRPDGMPPDRAVSVDPGRPQRLDPDELARRLRRLPDWTGDEHGIKRTVAVPAERIEPLVNRVQREARTMNDHAAVHRGPDEVTFALHTDGYVTEPDLLLASRIDTILAGYG